MVPMTMQMQADADAKSKVKKKCRCGTPKWYIANSADSLEGETGNET
jgi:hypothetical protein